MLILDGDRHDPDALLPAIARAGRPGRHEPRRRWRRNDRVAPLPPSRGRDRTARRWLARSVAQAEVPAGGHLGLPRVVAAAGRRSRSSSRSTQAGPAAPGTGSRLRGGGTRTRSTPSGTTPRSDARCSRPFDSALLTMLIAVPLGIAFAIGIDRWHGGRPATGATFVMLLLVRDARDHPGRLAVPRLPAPADVRPARDHGADPRAGDVPDLLSRHHRPRPVLIDRARVRGSGDGPRGPADAGDPKGAAPAAVPGDPGERRARVRRHGRRLRDRQVPVGAGDRPSRCP